MATKIIMPHIGGAVVDGTIKKWLVKEGDEVKRYQPVLEIASDKVTIEAPAPASGVILKIYIRAGERAPVGATLALIGDPETEQRPED